ncbi:hypothetical protein LUZ61_016987 [Rhynchospora tenuis]|uniref:Exocyst subunit Exo70 family protein n=1 Tax=Rhynchospora tenuis TaxID=198213 RepID=A0AAD5Z6L2_9POAL|nr:hypothetical protein LUZ61_016987 [Rhynchospora tenuis]
MEDQLKKLKDHLTETLEKRRIKKEELEKVGVKIDERTSTHNAAIECTEFSSPTSPTRKEKASALPGLEALWAYRNLTKTIEQFEEIESAVEGVNKEEEILSKWPFQDLDVFFEAFDRLGDIQQFLYSKKSNKLIEDIRTRVNTLLRKAADDIKSVPSILEVVANKDKSTSLWFLLTGIHRLVKSLESSQSGKEWLEKKWIIDQSTALTRYKQEFMSASLAKVLTTLSREGLESPRKDIIAERLVAFDTQFEELHRAQCQLKVSDSKLRDELQVYASNTLATAYTSFLIYFRAIEDNIRHTDPDEIAKKVADFYEGEAPAQKENIGEVQDTACPEKSCTNSEDAGPSNPSPN